MRTVVGILLIVVGLVIGYWLIRGQGNTLWGDVQNLGGPAPKG